MTIPAYSNIRTQPFVEKPAGGKSILDRSTPLLDSLPMSVVSPRNPVNITSKVPTIDHLRSLHPGLISQAPVSEPSESEQAPFEPTGESIKEFQEEMAESFGLSTQQISDHAFQSLNQEIDKLNKLATKIKPGAKDWSEALPILEKTRMSSSSEILSSYRQAIDRTLSWFKDNDIASPPKIRPSVVEDKEHVGTGAYAKSPNMVVETSNRESDNLLSASPPFSTIHEVTHILDNEVNNYTVNPHTEGLAFFIESEALRRGNFYKTPEEEFMARKWQAVRQARAYLSVQIQEGKMTPTQAEQFLTEKLHHNPANAHEEVKLMQEAPLQKLSYAVGAGQIEELWQRVQRWPKPPTFRQFVDSLLAVGAEREGDDNGSILDYARKQYGIDLAKPAGTSTLKP